jgi:hypothetical protein
MLRQHVQALLGNDTDQPVVKTLDIATALLSESHFRSHGNAPAALAVQPVAACISWRTLATRAWGSALLGPLNPAMLSLLGHYQY